MPYTLRPFVSADDYAACTRLQEEVWGEGFSESVSAAILKVANRLGGLSAGAFDEQGILQGFVFGLTGVVEGRLVHWSDMLAVRPEGRDMGLGTRLKHYQREVLLARGVTRMHWTFDPLQGRNAYLNFQKLGIVCEEYVEDMYGDTESPLHRGIGTDRLVATWEMDSQRVKDRLERCGEKMPPSEAEGAAVVLPFEDLGAFPGPGQPRMDVDEAHLLVSVPGNIDAMMHSNLALAVRWREATRTLFQHYLPRGYLVREFFREGPISSYLLERS
jgi:chorismate synthase